MRFSRVALALALGIVAACGAGGSPKSSGSNLGSGASTGKGIITSGGSGGSQSSGSGAGPSSGGTDSIVVPDAGEGGAAAGRETRCDDAGNCSCINIGLLGRLPSYGAIPGQDGTSAFQEWLNSKSSAAVSLVATDTDLTPEFLANYDVLILQALETQEGGPYWNISGDDQKNLEDWVRKGGGVLTLTGYGSQSAEVNPTNSLLSFSGLSYATDDILKEGDCPDGCCYCAGSSVPLEGWKTSHPISKNITTVGAFHGRSVMAPASASIVAEGTTVFGATVEVDAGRVFTFADEWVTYTSQWNGDTGQDHPECETGANSTCAGHLANDIYQVPQFWYNAIAWVSGDRECFTIDDPQIVK